MPAKPNHFYKYIIPVIAFIALLFSACLHKSNTVDIPLKRQIQIADSLYFINKGKEGLQLLHRIRPQLQTNSTLANAYYYLIAGSYYKNPKESDLYADSTLLLFKNPDNISKYPEAYFNALMVKGDACLRTGKYTTALDYYYKAKKALPASGKCDDGDLSSKIGVIYYDQKNFKRAAHYWADCERKLKQCPPGTAQELFLKQQGALDNTGVCYEKAGMLDSADYYYLQDLALIKQAQKLKTVDQANINSALGVLYDNLGGLNLKLDNLKAAGYYLNQSLAIPNAERDGSRIPPLIKLAELSIRLGDYATAEKSFKHSKALLNKYRDANTSSEVKWNKIFAQYLAKINKPDSAYYFLDAAVKLQDSIERNSTELYRLNVEKELKGIQQDQSLIELAQRDKVKKLYLIGAGTLAVMFVLLLMLIYRNLKASRKNQQKISLHNHELQAALTELERVNKNYIRVMRVMAHDLRNPLAGMTGIASMLLNEEEPLSEDGRYMLQLIESTGIQSTGMINELLKNGLADEQEQIVKQALDLKSLLYDSVELLQFKAQEKQQQILFESDNDTIMAEVSHEKLWRVFNNLIVNAIKFSHEGGEIRVGIKSAGNHVLISVADSGIGIPAENKDSIFDMFTPAKKVGTGGEEAFGLGLSISKKIVELHGGRVWFESVLNKGTTFYIELPQYN